MMIGRQSGFLFLIATALAAFFLPLAGRFVWQQYQHHQASLASTSAWPLGSTRSTMAAPRAMERGSEFGPPRMPNPTESFDGRYEAASPPVAQASYYSHPSSVSPTHTRSIASPGVQARHPQEPAGDLRSGVNDPLHEIRPLLVKLGLVSAVLVTVCVICLRLGKSSRNLLQELGQIQVADSINVSKDVGVKLICVGKQRLVVGHDRRGLQSLVLIPDRFDECLREAQDPPGEDPLLEGRYRDVVRAALASAEDDGWDLIRRTS